MEGVKVEGVMVVVVAVGKEGLAEGVMVAVGVMVGMLAPVSWVKGRYLLVQLCSEESHILGF